MTIWLHADERKEAINSLLNELIMNLRKELEGLEIEHGKDIFGRSEEDSA